MAKSGLGFVPSPWYVCFEFFRVIGIGFAVSMSWLWDPRRTGARRDANEQQSDFLLQDLGIPCGLSTNVEEQTKDPNVC
jgi:hypothetical protein